MVARVAIDAALDRLFDYVIPSGWEARAGPRARVRVPFGRRTAVGYVVELTESSAFSGRQEEGGGGRPLKPILAVEGERPLILPVLLRLARWIAGYYCAPVEICLRALLPAPVRDGRARDKTLLFVEAAAEPAAEARGNDGEAPPPLNPRRRELLENIRRVGGGRLQALCAEFSCSPETLRKLAADGYLTITPRVVRRDPLANRRILPTTPLALMPEQAAALATIVAACDAAAETSSSAPAASPPRPILLHGVTGSGKTEVYLQAIAHVLARERGAIVLVPEIALTPQTVQRFAGRFGARIAVLHSALGGGERHDEWQRIRKGEARVVIGPRSAVFAPVERLGLIVVDEEHEPGYKQEEAPRYHARDVAVMRARLEPCAVVLGSATPSLESWHNARRGKYLLARLPRRADNAAMPLVHVVDMRRELARSGRVQVFSRLMLEAIGDRLGRGEQTMLFLNRRGYATALICPACGFAAVCEDCGVAFTYHRVDDCLRCHICGGWRRPPPACPACHDPRFRYTGFGTQRVEQIVARCFPRARVARLDTDTTARKLSHEEILGAFRAGRTDILIGTQMIAKGLHFPNVTLVGIVLADSTLHLPDFRAGERTFQLLAQVAGRTGRGATPGEVVVQTYTPEHPAVTAARTEDFEAFAAGELPAREKLGYPPFTRLACLTLRGTDEQQVAVAAAGLARVLRETAGAGVRVSDSSPAPLAKARGQYRYQVLLRSPSAAELLRTLRPALREHRPPKGVVLAADMDAFSLM
jgi:primosomal protein N' (replication factor Y)